MMTYFSNSKLTFCLSFQTNYFLQISYQTECHPNLRIFMDLKSWNGTHVLSTVEILSTREPDASSDNLGIVHGWKEFIILKVEMPCKVKDPQKVSQAIDQIFNLLRIGFVDSTDILEQN